jgi:maltooligosyltrehalose synthase
VIVPRLVWPLIDHATVPLPSGWGDTMLELPAAVHGRRLGDVLSGDEGHAAAPVRLPLAETLGGLPVAVLTT